MLGTISEKSVEALGPGSTLWDARLRGLGVRRLPSGALSYGVEVTVDGRQRWLTLNKGGLPMKVVIAREEAHKLLARSPGGLIRHESATVARVTR